VTFWTDGDITILVPMLGRPNRVAPLLATIDATAPDAHVLFCLTPGDSGVLAAVRAAGRPWIVVDRRPVGDYARKINTGYRRTTAPLIFCAADDLRFHPDWWQHATAALTPGVGVVGTNDLGSPRVMRGEHATHSLITRDYADTHGVIDQPGAILHEGYPHEYVDDELVATAKRRGAWAFAPNSHVEHLHPNWGKGHVDALYRQQPARMRQGRPMFEARRRLWT